MYSTVDFSYDKSGSESDHKYSIVHSETSRKDLGSEQRLSVDAIANSYHIQEYTRLQGMEDAEHHRIAAQERVKEEKV